MTAPIVIRHGVRSTTFALDGGALVPVAVVDDFGQKSGKTEYRPAAAWVSDEARREAEAQVAVVLRYGVAGERQTRP